MPYLVDDGGKFLSRMEAKDGSFGLGLIRLRMEGPRKITVSTNDQYSNWC
jgi:hypothetical protein